MFVDKVQVSVHAGDGGDGGLSFRHEKFVDRGGPDGGDGGDGGDIILVASQGQNTLASFRYKKLLKAEAGQNGSKRRRHGKNGADLIAQVPVGTVVMNNEGEILADFTTDEQQMVIAKGGKGGFGNAHFVSSTRQAPRVAEKGEKGESSELVLELKMIADVGIVGLPNAGKSTLLARVSNAHPEIADYPFTTLRPNLGVVDIDETTSLLFADIPGLIEGASTGKGLGDDFLRHIERTRVLIHLIDIYGDAAKAYQTIQTELSQYKVDLTDRPQIVALNKIDGMAPGMLKAKQAELKKVLPTRSKIKLISAASGAGIKELLFAVKEASARALPTVEPVEELPVITLPKNDDMWEITEKNDYFIVTGRKIERFAARTDFANPAGVQRLRDIMKKMGILQELKRRGAMPGQKIKLGQQGRVEY